MTKIKFVIVVDEAKVWTERDLKEWIRYLGMFEDASREDVLEALADEYFTKGAFPEYCTAQRTEIQK